MKTLIIYFSITGHTKKIAQMIQKETNGDLFEVQVKRPYETKRVSRMRVLTELATGCNVELKEIPAELNKYDTIFIGSPLWIQTFATPILSLLKQLDLSGKTVIPFCTHGGGGMGNCESTIRKAFPNSTSKKGLDILEDGGQQAESIVHNWLRSISL